MTAGGCPSAAARFTTRPLASRFSRRPPTSNSSTSGRTARRASAAARKRVEVDLDVEVAGVGEDRAVLHALEVLGAEHGAAAPVTVMKTSPRSAACERRQDLEALHPRLERADRVDLADDHARAEAVRAQRDARLPVQP